MIFKPHAPYDYGTKGRIGVATPQANPTVEAEFSVLYPRSVSVQASRLASQLADPRARLVSYAEDLDKTLMTYGKMPLTAFGFACTGTSYLIGREAEADMEKRLADQFGYPIVTAANAIDLALQALNAKRIAIVMPYPEWLSDASVSYWMKAGYDVASVTRVQTRTSNTETIYELSSHDATLSLQGIGAEGLDAVLLSGTGMPTLAAIDRIALGIPVISSNLCLAWQLLNAAGEVDLTEPDNPPHIAGWTERLAEVTG